MEKRRTQYFKYLFHIILQMLPIPLHGDLVPNEMKLWNRSERFFFLPSFTNLFFPTLPFRGERGREDKEDSGDSGPVSLWQGLTGLWQLG